MKFGIEVLNMEKMKKENRKEKKATCERKLKRTHKQNKQQTRQ